jgi:hypothetical protein
MKSRDQPNSTERLMKVFRDEDLSEPISLASEEKRVLKGA